MVKNFRGYLGKGRRKNGKNGGKRKKHNSRSARDRKSGELTNIRLGEGFHKVERDFCLIQVLEKKKVEGEVTLHLTKMGKKKFSHSGGGGKKEVQKREKKGLLPFKE